MASPPSPSPRQQRHLSDLVLDSQIETVDLGNALLHVFYRSGRSARDRYVRIEERWVRETTLGSGAYGTVFRERCDSNGDEVDESDDATRFRAVKEIKKVVLTRDCLDYTRELEAVMKFSHPKYSHCFVRSDGWFELEDSIFIAMEYLPLGDLGRFLEKPLPELDTRYIVSQILEGLGYMHSNGFVHRDLKPGNIMVVTSKPAWFVKIADFGISKRRQAELTLSHTTYRGTLGFAAPEQLGLRAQDPTALLSPFALDIWSLGAVTYKIATGQIPFGLTDLVAYVAGTVDFPSSRLQDCGISHDGLTFVQGLMQPVAGSRLDVASASKHAWMQVPTMILEPEAAVERHPRVDNTDMDASVASAAWSDEDSARLDVATYRPPPPILKAASTPATTTTKSPALTAGVQFAPELTNMAPVSSRYRHPYAESLSEASDRGLSSEDSSDSGGEPYSPLPPTRKGPREDQLNDMTEVEQTGADYWPRYRRRAPIAERASYHDGMSVRSELLSAEEDLDWDRLKQEWSDQPSSAGQLLTAQNLRRLQGERARRSPPPLPPHQSAVRILGMPPQPGGKTTEPLFINRISSVEEFWDNLMPSLARRIAPKIMEEAGQVSICYNSESFEASIASFDFKLRHPSTEYSLQNTLDLLHSSRSHIHWFCKIFAGLKRLADGGSDDSKRLKGRFYLLLYEMYPAFAKNEWSLKAMCDLLQRYLTPLHRKNFDHTSYSIYFFRHMLGLMTLAIDLRPVSGRSQIYSIGSLHLEFREQNLQIHGPSQGVVVRSFAQASQLV